MTDDFYNPPNDYAETEAPDYLPVISMTELYDSVYRSKPPIIEGLLYPGSYLFVGSPKQGKSFLMLQLTYHVSAGLPLWGHFVHQGTVLYLSLEDDHPRLQKRLFRMFQENATDTLFLSTWAKKIGDGLEDQIKGFVKRHPNTKLVVIDTLKRVRNSLANTSGYDDDYDFAAAITNLARTLGLCIIIVHHTRKLKADNKFDLISGTNGLYGAVDGAMILEKTDTYSKNATLTIQGRDQPEVMLELDKDLETLQWKLKKEHADLWIEPTDPILDAVAAIVSYETPKWSGTATELVSCTGIDIKPNQLSIRLNVNAQRLKNEYNIRYQNTRSHTGRKITLQLILEEV